MTMLNSITPQNEIKAALDDVLRIYIDSWAKGDYFVSASDSSYLIDLAGRNPRYYGSAVEIARVMMNLDQVDYFDSASARLSRSNELVVIPINSESFNEVGVIPNPNSGKMIFRNLDENPGGKLIIFNSMGDQIAIQSILKPETEIELIHSKPGIYHFLFVSESRTMEFGKFVIIK